jgi:hypothetical protein
MQANACICILCAGVEGLAKEIEALRIAAQNEMLLNEESSPAAVLDELQQLRSQLAAHAQELARINQFQRLFKVRRLNQWMQLRGH